MKINLDPKNIRLPLLLLTFGLGVPFVVILMIRGERAFGGYENIFLTILYLLFIIVNSATLWKIYIKKVQMDPKSLKFRNTVIYVNALMSQNLLHVLDDWNKTVAIAMFLFLIYLIFCAYRNDKFFKKELRKIGADSMDFELYDTVSVNQDLKTRMLREYTLSAITVMIAGATWFVGIGLMLFSSGG